MATLTDSKIRIKQLKRLTSSLFARRSKYLVIGKDHPEVWYFTSIPVNNVAYTLRYDTECRIHCVTFEDPDLYENLFVLFPALRGLSFILDIEKFNSQLTLADKEKRSVDPIIQTIHQLSIQEIPVGQEISSDQLAAYRVPYEQYILSKDTAEKILHVPIHVDSKSELHFIPLLTDDAGSLRPIRRISIPYIDGLTGVSYFEYIKKCKTPVTYQLEYWLSEDLFYVTSHFMEEHGIDVVSVLPKVIFHPVYKITEETSNHE